MRKLLQWPTSVGYRTQTTSVADPDTTYHPDANPNADLDSDSYLMRIRMRSVSGFLFKADADPEPTFHRDADPGPDLSFQLKAQALEEVLK